MFIDLNTFLSLSALHLAHPLSHPIMASFWYSFLLFFKTTAFSTLSVCYNCIALLWNLVIFMNQWTSRPTGNPVIWVGKNWLSAVPLERELSLWTNKPAQKPIYLECLFSVTLKFFQAAAPKENIVYRLSQDCCLSTFTYNPLLPTVWVTVAHYHLNCLLMVMMMSYKLRKRVWLLIPRDYRPNNYCY